MALDEVWVHWRLRANLFLDAKVLMASAFSFRAAILERSLSPLRIGRIDWSGQLLPGQVLVRLEFSGICGAQINEIDAVKGPDKFLPHLLGHEGYGQVVEIGPAVTTVAPGENVVLHWMQGAGIQSENPSYQDEKGTVNAGWVTSLSEFAVISENRCTPIVSDLPSSLLPLFGCAATTAAGVIGKEAKLRLGESLVVLGAGGVGLLAIMAARASGASDIVAVDIAQNRLAAAEDAGANVTLLSKENETLRDVILERLGAPPDVVVETSGARPMIELAYTLGQPTGRVVLVGVPRVDEPVLIESLPLHFGMKLTGSKGGSSDPTRDIPMLVRAAESGIFPLGSMPLTILPLSKINEAIGALRGGAPGRVVIDCQQ